MKKELLVDSLQLKTFQKRKNVSNALKLCNKALKQWSVFSGIPRAT